MQELQSAEAAARTASREAQQYRAQLQSKCEELAECKQRLHSIQADLQVRCSATIALPSAQMLRVFRPDGCHILCALQAVLQKRQLLEALKAGLPESVQRGLAAKVHR
jgi:hypothetical protein